MFALKQMWRTITLPIFVCKGFAEGVKEGWNDPETQEIIRQMKADLDATSKELQARYEHVKANRTRKWSKRHRDLDY